MNATERDDAITVLWEQGTAGLYEESDSIRAFFEAAESVAQASRILEPLLVEIRKEGFHESSGTAALTVDPILVGKRFVVAPAWVNVTVPPTRTRITVDARSAFGSGRHESTQLMIEALESCDSEGATVIDVGCGSGILCMAAKLLGAQTVIGCDIDANAMVIARDMPDVPLFAGSADGVRSESADLVLANISTKVLDAIAPDLHRVAKTNGRILISGFIADSPPRKFQPERVWENREWQCWVCKPDPKLASTQIAPIIHARDWW